MARLTEHGLRRSVGVPGLFATAYGNVGSSIYYALGLVAAHALGLTPLVFLFAGGLFALTAKTYAEGASMFPEAGGSSSFARHAFDGITSFSTVPLKVDPSTALKVMGCRMIGCSITTPPNADGGVSRLKYADAPLAR